MFTQFSHVLGGWHRCYYGGNKRIKQWLAKREAAVVDAFKSIPGGKDVAQHMKKSGWLDLRPQVKAVQGGKRPLKPEQLRHFEPVILEVFQFKVDVGLGNVGKKALAIGLVDHKLQVRPLVVETPVMRSPENMALYPFIFHWQEDSETLIDQFERLSTTLQSCLVEYLHHLKKVPVQVQGPMFHRYNGVFPKCWGGWRTYPRFDEHGKALNRNRLIEKEADVKLILDVKMLTLDEYGATSFYGCDAVMQLKQLQIVTPVCKFDNDDEE